MTNDNKDNPDIYSLRDPSTLTEKVIVPSDNVEIFSIKNEDSTRYGAIIGVTLSEGIALCNAYRIDKRLSRDELGETWQASDLQASRNVVVYLPPLDRRTDASAMEPMQQAARRAEALEHPRIVPFLDNFTDPEHGFFSVRKFVNGTPLDVYRKEYIKRHKKLAPTKVVKMLSDIAHTLDYAHSVDVVHGDLRPKNIIVGLDDEVYVDNFALLPVQTIDIAGRKPYLAPEIVAGTAPSISSDVYALAVVAYELFSGRSPFASETMDDVPPPIPGVPSTVDVVIRKAMARDPDDRYGSCGAFVKALETSFQESAKIKSIAVTPSSKSRTNIAAHPLFWATLLGFLFAGVGVALVLQSQNVPPVSDEVAVKQSAEEVPNENDREQSNDESGHQQTNLSPSEETTGDDSATSNDERSPMMPSSDDQPSAEQQVESPSEPMVETNGQKQDEPTSPVTIVEPETPQNNGDTSPPIPEEPKPEITVRSNESERTLPSLADAMREHGEQTQITIGGVEYRFRWCKKESFMGGGFWIQETTVTQELWKTVMKAIDDRNDSLYPKKQPVVYVSWKDCEKFIENLNESDALKKETFLGCHFSLPTEAQWEHADNVNENILEWCHDWYDDTKNHRAVCGSEGYRNGRDPKGQQGYENVGFRLVIVRGK